MKMEPHICDRYAEGATDSLNSSLINSTQENNNGSSNHPNANLSGPLTDMNQFTSGTD